ncbi:anti-sigma-factor antagonist [Methanobacterium formicicum DSM 3637]|uniref:Anti-sigma-factor antagonist n=2 Tax=Methanobacterium formicicum TaxID=2162 RepID=K2R1L6_METFP|nr:anti-sigma-factor antagonist [Methanobacterium formicicum DSM 3637]
MGMDDEFELQVKADLENLSIIADFTTVSAGKLGLNDKGVFQLQLAVDEAASNIILHGYTHQTGPIHLTICKEKNNIIIRIEDRGEPFNPLKVLKPDLGAPLEERSPGGLGIHFLKTMTDRVHYQFKDGKNILTLVKTID